MEKVRRLRQEKGWNQTELAFYAGLAPSVISQVETGKRNPGAATLRKLADALGVGIPELFERTNVPKVLEPPPVAWGDAVRKAHQVRENGRTDVERQLWAWRGAKRGGDAKAADEHLKEIGKLLQDAYDAVTALWNTMSPGEAEWRELTEAEGCYRELIDYVERARLRVRRKRAGEDTAKDATDARHEVEEVAA